MSIQRQDGASSTSDQILAKGGMRATDMLEDQCLRHGDFAFGASVNDGTMFGIGACLPCSRSRKGCVRDYGFTMAAYVVAAVLIFLELGGRSGQ
jgi:hypothetical protein